MDGQDVVNWVHCRAFFVAYVQKNIIFLVEELTFLVFCLLKAILFILYILTPLANTQPVYVTYECCCVIMHTLFLYKQHFYKQRRAEICKELSKF